MLWTCSGHVSPVWGQKSSFPKHVGDVWAIIWYHRRCLGKGSTLVQESSSYECAQRLCIGALYGPKRSLEEENMEIWKSRQMHKSGRENYKFSEHGVLSKR